MVSISAPTHPHFPIFIQACLLLSAYFVFCICDPVSRIRFEGKHSFSHDMSILTLAVQIMVEVQYFFYFLQSQLIALVYIIHISQRISYIARDHNFLNTILLCHIFKIYFLHFLFFLLFYFPYPFFWYPFFNIQFILKYDS